MGRVIPIRRTKGAAQAKELPFDATVGFLLDFLFIQIPKLFFAITMAQALVDFPTGSWRAVLCLIGWKISQLNSRIGICIAVSTCCWLELPSLLLGFPNQFIFESLVIGVTCGLPNLAPRSTQKSQGSSYLLRFPFFTMNLFSIWAGLIASVIALGELYSYLGKDFNIPHFISSFLRGWYLWAPGENPFHSISIILGLLIHVVFFGRLFLLDQSKSVSGQDLLRTIQLSALVPFVIAILQIFIPGVFDSKYFVEISGSLQNGNHLSFFGGIVFLATLFSLLHNPSKNSLRWLQGFILAASGFIIYIGKGRTTWMALFICLLYLGYCISYEKFFRRLGAKKLGKMSLPKQSFLVFSVVTTTTALIYGICLISDSLSSLTSNSLLLRTLTAGGRQAHLEAAVQMFENHWFAGIGIGNFFRQAQLGYDIHNTYLSILTEQGMMGGIALLFAFTLATALILRDSSRQEFSSPISPPYFQLTALLYLGVASLMDFFISYRSLYFAFEAFLASILLLTKGRTHLNQIPRLSLYVVGICLALGSIAGFATLSNPRNWVFLPSSLPTTFAEHIASGTIEARWEKPFFSTTIEKGRCLTVLAKPSATLAAESPLYVSLIKDGIAPPSRNMSLSELAEWEKNSLHSTTAHQLWFGTWSNLCLCVDEDYSCGQGQKTCQIYLRALRSGYPSWTAKGSPDDLRYLGFALTKPTDILPQEIFHGATLHQKACTDLVHFGSANYF